jgi:hypothetical protein
MNKDLYIIFGYRQIWLNFASDDHHIFYTFLWMEIPTLATDKNSIRKHWLVLVGNLK